jgi:hypothetical protein
LGFGAAVLSASLGAPAFAQTCLDTVIFGNTASESSHRLIP